MPKDCPACGDTISLPYLVKACENCDAWYCGHGDCADDLDTCEGCSEYLCSDCGKYWRGEKYCDGCYTFPHDG